MGERFTGLRGGLSYEDRVGMGHLYPFCLVPSRHFPRIAREHAPIFMRVHSALTLVVVFKTQPASEQAKRTCDFSPLPRPFGTLIVGSRWSGLLRKFSPLTSCWQPHLRYHHTAIDMVVP